MTWTDFFQTNLEYFERRKRSLEAELVIVKEKIAELKELIKESK